MNDLTLAVIIGLLIILLLTVMITWSLVSHAREGLTYYEGVIARLRQDKTNHLNEISSLEAHLELYRAINAGLQEQLASLPPAATGTDAAHTSNVSKVLDYYR